MFSVWIVNHYAGGPGIGTGWRHWELGRRWAAQGIEVRIFTASTAIGGTTNPAREGTRVEDGVEFSFLRVPRYSGNGLGRLRNILAFNRAAARALRHTASVTHSPDVVLASSPQPFSWSAAGRFATAAGAAFVPEVRDLWPESLEQLGGLPSWHPMVVWCRRVVHRAYRDADAVASTLPGIAQCLRVHGVAAERCLVVPNGVDLQVAESPLQRELESQVALAGSEGRLILLYAGAIGIPNAMDQLVDAIALLDPGQRSRLRCLIAGDGTERARIERRAMATDPGVFRFLGHVPQDQARALMRRARAGFQGWLNLPLYRHGTSAQKISLMLGEGLPVIHAAPDAPDPVRDHGLGWSCPAQQPAALATAIKRMLDADENSLARMSERCREYVRERLDWNPIAAHALKNLQRIAQERATSRGALRANPPR
jgi:glycosyltransferase involved in cell wall biosynthesis